MLTFVYLWFDSTMYIHYFYVLNYLAGYTPCMARKPCRSLGTACGGYRVPLAARVAAARHASRGLRADRTIDSAGPGTNG